MATYKRVGNVSDSLSRRVFQNKFKFWLEKIDRSITYEYLSISFFPSLPYYRLLLASRSSADEPGSAGGVLWQ